MPNRTVVPATDVPWVACAIAWLGADAVAVQEIVLDDQGTAAVDDLLRRLDTLTAGRWVARFDDCHGSGRQHVGLLVNTRAVELSHPAVVPALNPGRGACDDSLRPGYGAYLRWPGGPDIHFVAVHLDSGPARHDYDHRVASLSHLADAFDSLQSLVSDSDVVVAGDFNTMGCEARGGCQPPVNAEQELTTIDRTLGALRVPFRRVPEDLPCTEYYRGRGHDLDHFVVSAALAELPSATHASVQGDCAASRCAPRHEPSESYSHVSDHCPVLLDLPRVDLDP